MSDGFLNIASTDMGGQGDLGRPLQSDRDDGITANLRTAIGWLPLAVLIAAGGWLMLSQLREPLKATPVAPVASTVGLAGTASFGPTAFDPTLSEAIVPEQPSPIDRLKISSQSWRRGGLGSNAFVTMTLRNDNGYAVRDIDVTCAFSRRD